MSEQATSTAPVMDDATRNRIWSAKIQQLRDENEAAKNAVPDAFPWAFAPYTSAPKPETNFAHLPEHVQVEIMAYLAVDLHVTLRKKPDATGAGYHDETVAYMLNGDEWRAYEAQFVVCKAWREGMNAAWRQELTSKRIAIVLDMRDSVRSADERATDEWYTIATVTNEAEIDRAPALYLQQYLALRIVSPYLVRSVIKLFSATLIRPSAGHQVETFANPTWKTLEGSPNADLDLVFAGIEGKVYHHITEGTDFWEYWMPGHLAYFHDVMANNATKDVLPGREDLPAPSSMAACLRAYRGLMARKAEWEAQFRAQKKKAEDWAAEGRARHVRGRGIE